MHDKTNIDLKYVILNGYSGELPGQYLHIQRMLVTSARLKSDMCQAASTGQQHLFHKVCTNTAFLQAEETRHPLLVSRMFQYCLYCYSQTGIFGPFFTGSNLFWIYLYTFHTWSITLLFASILWPILNSNITRFECNKNSSSIHCNTRLINARRTSTSNQYPLNMHDSSQSRKFAAVLCKHRVLHS